MSIRRCRRGPPGASTRSSRSGRGKADRAFLERVFFKFLLNFTWWVNRKDAQGNNIFEGGFLGLDNIGVFNRSEPLPAGGYLEQADATGWMAMYSLTLMAIAMELAREEPAYEDAASKFWEHFLYIARAINHLGDDGDGMWDERGRLLLRCDPHARRPARADEGPIVSGTDTPICGRNSGTAARRFITRFQTSHGLVYRTSPRPHSQRGIDGRPRKGRAAAALDGRSRPAPHHSAEDVGREGVLVGFRDPQPVAGAQRRARSSSPPTGRSIRWDTSPGNRAQACSAATPTGAVRCGSR